MQSRIPPSIIDRKIFMSDSVEWSSDEELFGLIDRELFSCVVGDVLDKHGYLHQFLPERIRPLRPDMKVIGRAMTVLEADCHGTFVQHSQQEEAFGLMFDALDSLRPGEIYICTGSRGSYACWGELMSTRARFLSSRGAVIEGFSRDTHGILRLDFPTFSFGPYGQDQGVRGRVIDYRCPIQFSNGVRVDDGDLILGDIDGVVVVPAKVEQTIIEAALEKVRQENMVAKMIRKGMPTRQVWDEYGVM